MPVLFSISCFLSLQTYTKEERSAACAEHFVRRSLSVVHYPLIYLRQLVSSLFTYRTGLNISKMPAGRFYLNKVLVTRLNRQDVFSFLPHPLTLSHTRKTAVAFVGMKTYSKHFRLTS